MEPSLAEKNTMKLGNQPSPKSLSEQHWSEDDPSAAINKPLLYVRYVIRFGRSFPLLVPELFEPVLHDSDTGRRRLADIFNRDEALPVERHVVGREPPRPLQVW